MQLLKTGVGPHLGAVLTPVTDASVRHQQSREMSDGLRSGVTEDPPGEEFVIGAEGEGVREQRGSRTGRTRRWFAERVLWISGAW